MSSISFANVYLLFLIIPLVALVTVPFAVAVRSDNRNGHNIASFILHLLMAIIIAFAAAGTSFVTVITETDVYVVADVSYSANKNLDTVDGYIKNLKGNLPRNSKLGIICFGKDYEVLTELGGAIRSVKDANVDDSQTNIAAALTYAGSLFEDDVIKRIVVITDGRQSDLRDSNSLRRIAEELATKGVRVDAMYLDDNITENTREIQVSRAEFTKTAFLNKSERVVAYVQSSYVANNVRVSLYTGDTVVESRVDTLSLGTNAFSFNLPTGVEGTFDYEIRVEGLDDGEDTCLYNNSYSFTQKVSGAVNVLLVTGDGKNLDFVRGVYGEYSTIDSYVGSAQLGNVPYTVEDLCKYDEIVLADVDVTAHPYATMFLDSLDKVVSVFGKNLVTLGDLNIQSNEDPLIGKLDGMLPVNYGSNEGDPKLYTIVIDTSRSMETNYRQQISKQAAIRLLGQIAPKDYVCVVEFNGDFRVVRRPSALGDGIEATNSINGLGVTQGTLLNVGLQGAFDQMMSYTAFRQKRVMLITDGLTFDAGSGATDNPLEIVRQMRMNNIKIPVVIDVGRADTVSPESIAAEQLLRSIATESGNPEGYKFANSFELLDSIMMDVGDDMFKATVEESSTVLMRRTTDDTVSGLTVPDEDYAPTVGGFINSASKDGAVEVLRSRYYDDDESAYLSAPLYAYWKYGNGNVSTFTSSLAKNWADTTRWDELDKFFLNVLNKNIPSEKADYPFTVAVSTEGKYAQVEITPVNLYPDSTASIEVSAPDGQKTVYELASTSTSYCADFEIPDLGKYSIAITYSCNGEEYGADAYLDISYEAEYDLFVNFDASELYKMVGGSGLVSTDGTLKIVNDERDVGTYVMSLTVPLLAVCAALFVVDIIIRKLKWNDIKNLFIKVNKIK